MFSNKNLSSLNPWLLAPEMLLPYLATRLLQHEAVGWVKVPCLTEYPYLALLCLTQLNETKVRSRKPYSSFGGVVRVPGMEWHGVGWDGARIREAWAGTSQHGPGMANSTLPWRT